MSNKSFVDARKEMIDNYLDHEEDEDDGYLFDTGEQVDEQLETKLDNEHMNGQSTDSPANEHMNNQSTDSPANEHMNDQSTDSPDNEQPEMKNTNSPANEHTNDQSSATPSSNQPHISIEVSDTRAPPEMSNESLQQTIDSAKQSFIESLSADVEKLEESNSVRIADEGIYLHTSEEFKNFHIFLLKPLYVPSSVSITLTMNDYINAVTTFKYDAYDSPNVSITHSLSEAVIHLKRLSKLFDFEFLSAMSAKWKFDELDDKLATFMSKYNDLPSMKLEYELIRTFLGKLVISLSTTTERALREQRTPLVNSLYRSVIAYDVAVMNKLKGESKFFASWSKFMDAFYATSADNFVYTHTSYAKLNEHLKIAYGNDFITEIMLANMLKCYFPSIGLNYFYVIKCVYLIARMISVYIHLLSTKEEMKGRSISEIMNDLNTIVSVGVIIYENKNYLFKQTSHSLPRSNCDVSEKTNMYILNHLFTGGQFYLLKMFERSVPSLCNMIAGNLQK